ncbi:DUF6881 domain-containing protein [Streptomyces sp. NPDC059161]|uniref:DUF6881 domain-containing protein n=1 Tax=Streptomyces sp. NPDC059161 TaxID=3346749 RepID=UPI003686D40A
MTSYVKMRWEHEFAQEPVELFSELDDDRYEVSKVEVYRDGRLDWADAGRDTDTSGLGEVPFPDLDACVYRLHRAVADVHRGRVLGVGPGARAMVSSACATGAAAINFDGFGGGAAAWRQARRSSQRQFAQAPWGVPPA